MRPHVPSSAAGAVGALAACGLLLEAAWRRYTATGEASAPVPVTIGCVAMGAVALAAGMVSQTRGPGRARGCAGACLLWCGAGVLLGVLASCGWIARWNAAAGSLAGMTAGSYRFVTSGDPSVGEHGASMSAVAYGPDGSAAGAVRLTADEPHQAGTELTVIGRIAPLGESDWARSRFMKGEVASVDVARVVSVGAAAGIDPIGSVRAAALRAIDPGRNEARALVAGVVCGYTTELNRAPASDAFARAGLTHLVAVSGSHLAFIALLLQGFLRALRLRPAARTAVLVSAMAAYTVFTGCAPSAVRSVAMVAAGMVSGLGQRRPHAFSGLALTVLALAVANPGIVFDLGFQLSAMSVLFILALGGYTAHLLRRAGLPELLAAPLSLTLVAQWATVPLTVPIFGQLSLIAPVANLVAGPLMSALLVIGLVTIPLCTALPVLALLMAVPEVLARASVFVGELFAGAPCASLPVALEPVHLLPLYIVAILLFALWRDWRRWQLRAVAGAVAAAAGMLVARWALFAPAAVTVLDVGQADAILVREGPSTLLVDAGVDEEALAALARAHVFRLDAVVITHWDRDHWGGLPDILEQLPVDRVLVAAGAAKRVPSELERELGGRLAELSAGDALRVGGFACEVVWPLGPVAGEKNGDSLCLDVSYRGRGAGLSMLLTGDTECGEAARYAPAVGDIDVLKAGHHGSAASLDARMMGELSPEVVVASAGEGNAYGHPDPACVAAAREGGAAFACTKDAGDVTVYPGERGARVVVSRGGAVE